MASKEELHRLSLSHLSGTEMDEETREWLEADLSDPLPPYEWGPEGPTEGRPVHYIPGVGLVVVGGRGLTHANIGQ